MSQHNFDRLLQKYLLGECSPQEEAKVLKWYQHLIDRSKLEISEDEKDLIQAKIWSNLSGGIAIEQVPSIKSSKPFVNLRIIYSLAIAASVLLFVSAGWYYFTKTNTSNDFAAGNTSIPPAYISLTNQGATEQEITLADGSTVGLQPKATLYYPRTFTSNSREVYLTGNAFFKVFRNPAQHFMVHTEGLVTEVLGTSFRIHRDKSANKFEIAVVSGKVSVYKQDTRIKSAGNNFHPGTVILTSNQMVTYDASNSQFITSLVEEPQLMNEYIKTDTVNFIFDDVPLSKVLGSLKKAYGIEIITESKNMVNCHFTGDITKQGLYKKLEIICQSFPLSSYEVRGTTINLKGKGCN
ncbi:MAG: FecR family protein [Ferruginibacter sp.]|nr:FecR family protein [Ferruginibacter sp.]